MKKNNIENLILSIACILTVQLLAVSAPTSQIPVSASYDDMINVAREQVSSSPATGDIQVQARAQEEPLAPRGDLAYSNATPEAQVANTTAIQPQVQQTQTKPKKSFASMVFKFILAMIWVVISSIVIFIILISYKRFILKGKPVRPTYETTEQSLDTPKNFKEAIKLFLDKTKW